MISHRGESRRLWGRGDSFELISALVLDRQFRPLVKQLPITIAIVIASQRALILVK